MLEKGIKAEMEIYQPGQYWVGNELIRRELVKPPYVFQFIMGYQTSIYPSPQNLLSMVRELPNGSLFSVVGIGKYQWPLIALSILLGGHVRVGLETIYTPAGGASSRATARLSRRSCG